MLKLLIHTLRGFFSIKEKIVKGDKEYLIGGISLDVTVATIQGPVQMITNEPFQVYGKATPGSTVEVYEFDTYAERYTKLVDAQLYGEWYTATVPGLTKDAELVAKVKKIHSQYIHKAGVLLYLIK